MHPLILEILVLSYVIVQYAKHVVKKPPEPEVYSSACPIQDTPHSALMCIDTRTKIMCHAGQGSGSNKFEHIPRVRWYDARVRTALRRVASWLNVPWPAVGNFEHLLAYQVRAPPHLRVSPVILYTSSQALPVQQALQHIKSCFMV